MTKRIVVHRRADIDIDEIVDRLVREQGAENARRFLAAARRSIDEAGRRPRLGSPTFAESLAIPNLRARAIDRFPFTVFYLDLDDSVRIVRVLHRRRDVARLVTGFEEDLDLLDEAPDEAQRD